MVVATFPARFRDLQMELPLPVPVASVSGVGLCGQMSGLCGVSMSWRSLAPLSSLRLRTRTRLCPKVEI